MLARDLSAESAFRIVARAGLAQIGANAPGVLHSDDAEFVHQMRVGIRRFRSSLVAFRAVIPRAAGARLGDAMRGVSDALAAARDWDVLCAQLASVREKRTAERASLEALQRHAARRCAAARRRARERVGDGEFLGVMPAIGRWVGRSPWRRSVPRDTLAEPVAILSRRVLRRLYRKVLKCGADAAALQSDDRHRLRIRIKRLRYACEFFAALYPHRRARSFVRGLERLQDTLGGLNDIDVATRLLGDVSEVPSGARRALARMHGRHARRQRRLLSELDARWKALKRADPFW